MGPRYLAAAAANLGAAAVFTALAARRLRGQALSAPNLVTLSRAGAAAALCGTVFSGAGRRAGFWALLIGCTASDWLDGPIARRLGPTPLGALLDAEADSWLTLWGAAAGFRIGRLPGISLLPPALRYLVAPGPAAALRHWQRAAGVAQMVIVAVALSRWRPPRALAALAAATQMAALVAGGGRDARRPAARYFSIGTRMVLPHSVQEPS